MEAGPPHLAGNGSGNRRFPVGHPSSFARCAAPASPAGIEGRGSWRVEGMEGKNRIWQRSFFGVFGEPSLLPRGAERGRTDDPLPPALPGPPTNRPVHPRNVEGMGSPPEELSWDEGSPGGVHSGNPREAKPPTQRAPTMTLPPRSNLAWVRGAQPQTPAVGRVAPVGR